MHPSQILQESNDNARAQRALCPAERLMRTRAQEQVERQRMETQGADERKRVEHARKWGLVR